MGRKLDEGPFATPSEPEGEGQNQETGSAIDGQAGQTAGDETAAEEPFDDEAFDGPEETEPEWEAEEGEPQDQEYAQGYDAEEEGEAAQPEGTGSPGPDKKRGRLVTWIVIAAAAVVLVVALVNIIGIGGEDMASHNDYTSIKEVADGAGDAWTEDVDPRDRKIDFDALKQLNGDVTGWIYIAGSSIDYPIVQGEDNDYYITHTAKKEVNRAGAIFLDYRNAPAFTDKNTIIYGHRMNNGSMFADLHKFEDEAFFNANDKVYVYLPDGGVSVYRVFAAYTANDIDDAYTMDFADDGAYEKYLKTMQQRSTVPTDAGLDAGDRIITLSTCVQGQDDKRYIVQAVLEQ